MKLGRKEILSFINGNVEIVSFINFIDCIAVGNNHGVLYCTALYVNYY